MSFILTDNIEKLHDIALKQLEANNRDDFFNSLEWYKIFSQNCLEEGAQPLFLSGESGTGTECFGFALCMRTPAGQPGSKITSSLFKNKTVASLTNYQSERYAPILCGDICTEDSIQLMAEGIREKLSDYDLFDFNQCDPKLHAARQIARAFRLADFYVNPYVYMRTMVEDTQGQSFDDYMSARSRNFRYNIKRREKQLNKLGRVKYRIVRDNYNLESFIANYEHVLAASWKKPEPFPHFSRKIIRAAARCGTLRLGFLFLDDKPIATQFWIVTDGRATIYKLHYDAEYSGKYSIGSLLTVKMIKHVIENDAVVSIDYGTGEDKHKQKFMSQKQELGGVVAFSRRTLQSRMLEIECRVRTSASRAIRQSIKSVLPDTIFAFLKKLLMKKMIPPCRKNDA
jgi:Acetyltransferase (GNAT) domain